MITKIRNQIAVTDKTIAMILSKSVNGLPLA